MFPEDEKQGAPRRLTSRRIHSTQHGGAVLDYGAGHYREPRGDAYYFIKWGPGACAGDSFRKDRIRNLCYKAVLIQPILPPATAFCLHGPGAQAGGHLSSDPQRPPALGCAHSQMLTSISPGCFIPCPLHFLHYYNQLIHPSYHRPCCQPLAYLYRDPWTMWELGAPTPCTYNF